MKKRGNENSQLRAEEVEALNDEDSGNAGMFSKASSEEMSRRKIIKSKRPSGIPNENQSNTTNGKTNGNTNTNPFASFGTSLTQSSTQPPPASANPFGGFSGLSFPSTLPSSTLLQKISSALPSFPATSSTFPTGNAFGSSNNNSNGTSSNTNTFGFPAQTPLITIPKPIQTTSNAPVSTVQPGFNWNLPPPVNSINSANSMFQTNNISALPFTSINTLNNTIKNAQSNNISSLTTNNTSNNQSNQNNQIKSNTNNGHNGSNALGDHSESEYKKKMKKLNTSISAWMDKQIVDHPFSIWKDGLKDYIQYATHIIEKYGDEKTSTETPSTINNQILPINSNALPISNNAFPSTLSGIANKNASNMNFFNPSNTSSTLPSTLPTQPSTTPAFPSIGLSTNFSTTFPPAVSSAITSTAPDPFSFGSGGMLGSCAGLGSSVVSGVSSVGGFGGFGAGGSLGGLGVGGENGGDDDEGEPILEAEKVLRNKDDTDVIIIDCACKLFRFDSSKGDNGKGEWIDVGKGNFRITKPLDNDKQRMLVRNSVGKITFNAAFYKNMKIEIKNKGLSFGCVVDVSGELKMFLLKVKDENLNSVLDAMKAAVAIL